MSANAMPEAPKPAWRTLRAACAWRSARAASGMAADAGGDVLQKRATTDNGRHTDGNLQADHGAAGISLSAPFHDGPNPPVGTPCSVGCGHSRTVRASRRAQTGCPDSVSGSALGNSDTPLSLGGEPWTDYQCWWSPSSYSMACRCGRAPTSRVLRPKALAPSAGDAGSGAVRCRASCVAVPAEACPERSAPKVLESLWLAAPRLPAPVQSAGWGRGSRWPWGCHRC